VFEMNLFGQTVREQWVGGRKGGWRKGAIWSNWLTRQMQKSSVHWLYNLGAVGGFAISHSSLPISPLQFKGPSHQI
jgi:hypothetical protein